MPSGRPCRRCCEADYPRQGGWAASGWFGLTGSAGRLNREHSACGRRGGLQDDRAAGLAQATGLPWAEIEQAREDCARDDVVPVLVLATSPEAVTCLVEASSPQAAKSMARPPSPETFRVVVVASGGNAFSDVPRRVAKEWRAEK